MPWTRKLKARIALDDGRRLVTLADVRALMMALPERHLANGHWLHAGELLLKAAEPDATKADLDAAERQLAVALRGEGLLERVRRKPS